MAAGLSAASPGDLEPFRAHLATRRLTERRHLVRGLRSARFTGLMADWRSALEAAARSSAGPEPDVGSLAADRIARVHRRVVRLGSALTRTRARRRTVRHRPALTAQAVQGTSLPAGVLRLAVRPARLPARGQEPQGPAGLPRRVPRW